MGKVTAIQRWVLIGLAGLLLLFGGLAVLDSKSSAPTQPQQSMF